MPHGRSPTGFRGVPKERAPGRHFDAVIRATARPTWSHELHANYAKPLRVSGLFILCDEQTGN